VYDINFLLHDITSKIVLHSIRKYDFLNMNLINVYIDLQVSLFVLKYLIRIGEFRAHFTS
jgi:hypothetical protein